MLRAEIEHDKVEKIVALLADDAGDNLRTAQLQPRTRLGKVEHGAQILILPLNLAQAKILHQQIGVDLLQLGCALAQRAQFGQKRKRVTH